MSHIMNKLKNLQTTVSGLHLRHKTSRTPHRTPQAGPEENPSTKSSSRLALILLAIIAFGIIGYMAGMRSGKIGPKEPAPETRVARANVFEVKDEETVLKTKTETEIGPPAGETYRETGRDEPLDPVIERIAPSDPPPAGDPVYTVAGAGKSDWLQGPIGSPDIEDTPAPGADRSTSELSGTIIRAAYQPVTAEEDLRNKKTVMKLKVLGVVEEDGVMIAIISGHEVKENDSFRGLIVDEITRDYVLFSCKDKQYRKLVR